MGRVKSLEEGAFEVPFLPQGEPLDQPGGLRFTTGGKHIGALRFQYFPAGAVFKVDVVNAECAGTAEYRNETSAALSKGSLLYNDDLRVVFGSDPYRFHFRDGAGYFKLTFIRST